MILEQDGPLDLLDRLGDLDVAGAGLGAVEDGAAAPDAVALVQDLAGAPPRPRSRLSKMKRWALTIAAGPMKLWFAQKGGQAVVQQAQRMHFVVSSKRSRSLGALQALAGRDCLVVDQVGHDRAIGGEERLHVDDQVLDDAVAAQRLDRDRRVPTSLTSVLQARRLRPLMSMASEPQTPCAHERR